MEPTSRIELEPPRYELGALPLCYAGEQPSDRLRSRCHSQRSFSSGVRDSNPSGRFGRPDAHLEQTPHNPRATRATVLVVHDVGPYFFFH